MTRTDCQLIARWRTVAMTLPLLGCAACSLFVVPGDGYLGVIGSVYEPAPEGVGVVLVDAERSASAENNARPIGGCAVTLEPWSPDMLSIACEGFTSVTRIAGSPRRPQNARSASTTT